MTLVLSHSSRKKYESCGEAYRLTKVEEVPTTPSWAMVGGSAVHTTTEADDLKRFGITPDGPTTFAEAFEVEIEDRERHSGVPSSEWRAAGRATKQWPHKEDRDWWLHAGPLMVRRWADFLDSGQYNIWITPEGEPAIELAVEGRIGDTDSRGFIDRVLVSVRQPEVPIVTDLKSGKQPEDHEQNATYSLLAPDYWPEIVYGAYFMTRNGVLTVPTDMRPLMSGQVQYQFDQSRAGIEAGIFPAKRSMMCNYCDVAKFCFATNGELSQDYSPFRQV